MGNVALDVRKRLKEFVRAVLNLMVIVRNGRNRMDAQFINVQESIMFNFHPRYSEALLQGHSARSCRDCARTRSLVLPNP